MTATWQDLTDRRAAASIAVGRASRLLLASQEAAGCWGSRCDDITLTAEGLLVCDFLGRGGGEQDSSAAERIRSLQRADGSWSGDGPGAGETASSTMIDSSTVERSTAGGARPPMIGACQAAEPGRSTHLAASVLAYLALRLAGDSPDAYHMALAAGWIREAGGSGAAGVAARTWLALFGLAAWDDVPVPAPELLYLAARGNVREWAAWSRHALATLTVLGAVRPVRRVPFGLGELRAWPSSGLPGQEAAAAHLPAGPARSAAQAARSAVRAAALRRHGQSLVDWHLRAGRPAGPRPVWPLTLIALHSLSSPISHQLLADGLDWLDSITDQAGDAEQGRVAGQLRPVRPTAAAVCALADAGVPAGHQAQLSAASWLAAQQIAGPAASGTTAVPSGWSFAADGYPVAADTASVLIALSRARRQGLTGQAGAAGALTWLSGQQSRDGSWAGSALATGLAVRALATLGGPGERGIRRGAVWLLRAQCPDGSWTSRPGENALEATTETVHALLAAGVLPAKPVVAAAVGWLASRQNSDGGWGPDGGPADRLLPSQAAATARAVLALLAVRGDLASARAGRGADWLVRAQRADGGWGVSVTALLLPLSALGRYLAAQPAEGAGRRPDGVASVAVSNAVPPRPRQPAAE